jgi:hypothetical protein
VRIIVTPCDPSRFRVAKQVFSRILQNPDLRNPDKPLNTEGLKHRTELSSWRQLMRAALATARSTFDGTLVNRDVTLNHQNPEYMLLVISQSSPSTGIAPQLLLDIFDK